MMQHRPSCGPRCSAQAPAPEVVPVRSYRQCRSQRSREKINGTDLSAVRQMLENAIARPGAAVCPVDFLLHGTSANGQAAADNEIAGTAHQRCSPQRAITSHKAL